MAADNSNNKGTKETRKRQKAWNEACYFSLPPHFLPFRYLVDGQLTWSQPGII